MGILDKLLRRGKKKEVGEEARYILKKRDKTGGMVKVSELAEPTPIDDLYENLVPGIYSLHKYKKGQTGFEVVWGPVEVLGEEAPAASTEVRRASPFAGLRQYAEEMKQTKEDLVASMEVLGPMLGYQKPGESKPKSLLDEIKEAKAQQKDLNEFFPLSTSKSQDIPIAGSIPAYMVYAPQMIDQAMDAVEKRLNRWGLIEGAAEGGAGAPEIIKLPDKPKRAEEKREEKETEKETEAGVGIKLPPKPEPKVEVKKLSDEEEKKKDVGGKGGESEEESE